MPAREHSDFDFSFKRNPFTNDVQSVKGVESVKSSISNILRTKNYDRLFQPNIGSAISSYLFEPMNNVTENRLQNSIIDTVRANEPRAEQFSVNVTGLPETNEYRIQIKFYVKDQLEVVEFETFLTRIR